MSYAFELGPIRPPSEAYSLLLRITRNCPWNKCAFCTSYKDQNFSRRSIEEIKKDIDSMHILAERIKSASMDLGLNGAINKMVINKARGHDTTPEHYYEQVAFWLQNGIKTAFLQDANSLLLNSAELVEILLYLKEKFPSIERITSYARAKTLSKKTQEELRQIRGAGLSRIHVGMESGCDSVLEMINKGVSSKELIIAGRMVMDAGFDLSEYYMPGLGGRELTRENALETARVVNEINPTFIRIRSTVPLPGTPLYELFVQKKWTPLTEDEKINEIKLFIENLNNISSTLTSDHMMNLLEDVEGTLPGEKQKMIDLADQYLGMSSSDRESFIIGRRLGYFRYLSDFIYDERIETLKQELKTRFTSIDAAVLELLKNFL